MKQDLNNCISRNKLLVIAVILCCFAAPPAFALLGGKVKHFSADSVTIDPSGKVVHTGKLYVSDDVMRMDGVGGMMGPGPGGRKAPDLSVLVFENKGVMYFYNHDKKLVYEGPVDEKDMGPGYKALENVASEKVVGKEKVSGYKCIKKEVVIPSNFMGMTRKDKITVWESDRFEAPLRTMTADGVIHEMRNIKESKPPKKLLKPIAGYKKVGNMMAVMGMDFGAMMADDAADDDIKTNRSQPDKVNPQPNMESMDVNKMMEQMNQAIGDNMNPEEKAQLMQIMAGAMNQAKQTKEGPGAAGQIWQIIPKRPGDKIGHELKTPYSLSVTMGTRAQLQSVFGFYKNKLSTEGWSDGGMYLQNGQGHLNMIKGQQTLTISSAENPGIKGNYTEFYMVQIQGPNL